MPAGWARLSWLLGGLWLVARQGCTLRAVGRRGAAVAAAVGVVCLGWQRGSTIPGASISRTGLIALVVMLMVLPAVVRRRLGPADEHGPARVVRAAAYALLCAMVPVIVLLSRFTTARFEHFHAFDQANWDADMVTGAIVGSVLLLVLMTAYAAGILATTAARSSVAPGTVGLGAVAGVVAGCILYSLSPLGNTLHVGGARLAGVYDAALLFVVFGSPVVSGVAAARGTLGRHRGSVRRAGAGGRQGMAAGAWTGAMGALVVGILTLSTMLLRPHDVTLRWANPDPNVPHGTTYEVQMSVGDTAQKYEGLLLLGPLVGAIIGGTTGAATGAVGGAGGSSGAGGGGDRRRSARRARGGGQPLMGGPAPVLRSAGAPAIR